MGLTSALNTSVNGLGLNETMIDVLGNNIANAGTNGFKASTVLFATQLSRTLSVGSRPTATNGGTNPRQIGLGASVAAVQRDFTPGGITNSTSPSDLAIQGDGFFVVRGSDGTAYTRNGNFSRSSDSYLVNPQGLFVQGYGVDENFNIVSTSLQDIRIPLGELTIAQQTQNVAFSGALFSTGDVASQGSQLLSGVMTDFSTSAPATAASLLTDLRNSSGQTLFPSGQSLTFGARKGGRAVEPQSLAVTAATTLADLTTLIDNALGIQSGAGIPDDPNNGPGQPGVSIVGGQIQITGNQGTENDVSIVLGDLLSNGTNVALPFTPQQSATGESTVTNFIVYDSLGQPIPVRMTSVLESRGPNASTFRWFMESPADSDADTAIASGTISFDGRGRVVDGGAATFAIDRLDTAALSPMLINVDFSGVSGISTQAAGSSVALSGQDGASPGTLTGFAIDEAGVINGLFDNGTIRPLGQLALARFSNPQGLLEDGDTTYREGIGSGPPFLATPGTFGAGTIRSGSIELSNTDLGKSLVDLIVASTNYRGNTRVIGSVQQLFDELLSLGR